jgi:hypothetical protein
MGIKTPSKVEHAERERVIVKLNKAARIFGGAHFSNAECKTLITVFEVLALEATARNMTIEKEHDPTIPTVGHVDIPSRDKS